MSEPRAHEPAQPIAGVRRLPHPVCFVCPELSAHELSTYGARDLAPAMLRSEAFLRALEQGRLELTWLVQTYLQLKARGQPVQLRRDFPTDDSICVYLSPLATRWGLGNLHQVRVALRELPAFEHARTGHAGFRVTLCPDRPAAKSGHVRVFQNPVAARAQGGLWISHWPQPALLPRDAARADRLENVVFVGLSHNLDAEFRAPEFRQALAQHGLTFSLRDNADWSDYQSADAVLAVRSRTVPPCMLALKPASKLINAWRAGVPALLGPEPAYRALRESPLDYLEVRDGREALEALLRLRSEAGLYRALRERAELRARDLSPAAVAAAWEDLLAGPIYTAHQRWSKRGGSQRLRALGYRLALGHELTAALRFWRRYAREQRRLTKP